MFALFYTEEFGDDILFCRRAMRWPSKDCRLRSFHDFDHNIVMKKLLFVFPSLFFSLFLVQVEASELYTFSQKDTDGKIFKFDQLKGKVVVLVNIATKCGFTGQLEDLQKLYTRYKNKGVVVVGIPSNNFLGQTPEDNKEVGNICRLKYGVDFPIMEKQEVIGSSKSQLIKWVHSHKEFDGTILWNFEKFIISKDGKVVDRFRSKTSPLDDDVIRSIEKQL